MGPSMTTCLVDANVWFAILFKWHEHHIPSRQWFETAAAQEAGMCRLVHLNLLRLLSNRVIMGPTAMSSRDAWNLVAELGEDERVEFLMEPPELDSVFPGLLSYPVPTGKLINDAYLAAFAICSNRELVTWDRGFQQFRGLRVKLLNA